MSSISAAMIYAPAVTPPVATPNPPVVTPSPPVVTPSPPVITPSPPVVTPGPPVVTPGPPVVTPAPPVVTPAPPVVTPAPPITVTVVQPGTLKRQHPCRYTVVLQLTVVLIMKTPLHLHIWLVYAANRKWVGIGSIELNVGTVGSTLMLSTIANVHISLVLRLLDPGARLTKT